MRFKHEVRELIRFAATLGYTAQRSNGGHVALERNGAKVFVPSTPGDRRWMRNAKALLIRKSKMENEVETNDGIVITDISYCSIPDLERDIADWKAQGLADEVIWSLAREQIEALRKSKKLMPKKIVLQREGWSDSLLRELCRPVLRVHFRKTQPGGSAYDWCDHYFYVTDILFAERQFPKPEILTYHVPIVPEDVPPAEAEVPKRTSEILRAPEAAPPVTDPMAALAARISAKVREFEEKLRADIAAKAKEFEQKLWADALKSIQ